MRRTFTAVSWPWPMCSTPCPTGASTTRRGTGTRSSRIFWKRAASILTRAWSTFSWRTRKSSWPSGKNTTTSAGSVREAGTRSWRNLTSPHEAGCYGRACDLGGDILKISLVPRNSIIASGAAIEFQIAARSAYTTDILRRHDAN